MASAEDLFPQQIDKLETCIPTDIEAARKQLRLLLFEQGESGESGTNTEGRVLIRKIRIAELADRNSCKSRRRD